MRPPGKWGWGPISRLNKRISATINGETIYTVYSLSGQLLYRDNITTGRHADTVTLGAGGMPIVRWDVGLLNYLHQDHLGTSVAATLTNGNIHWRETYTPYGELLQGANYNRNRQGYTGHIRDTDTGLTYMQARYYDPVIGRFLSNDPVGFAEGGVDYFNRYAYTANNPVNLVDPDGRCFGPLLRPCAQAAWRLGKKAVKAVVKQAEKIKQGKAAPPPPRVNTDNVELPLLIDEGKQGKHIRGHNNFDEDRSELTHSDPQGLVDEFAGTGDQVNQIPVGEAGSKERINFGEVIGTFSDIKTGEKTETTVGIISYSKDSVHIIPARPLEE